MYSNCFTKVKYSSIGMVGTMAIPAQYVRLNYVESKKGAAFPIIREATTSCTLG